MLQSLADKVALVTGSARRVGKAIALALAAEGANVVIHYYGSDAEVAQDTVREAKSFGVDAISFRADQADPPQVDHLFEAVQERFGRLDILVNSASIFERADFFEPVLCSVAACAGRQPHRAVPVQPGGGPPDVGAVPARWSDRQHR